MGKKRTVQKRGGGFDSELKARALSRAANKKVNALSWSSSGALGFKGTKKGTPFAAAKVGELLGERAQQVGMKGVNVIIRGVGSGRESSLRSFASKGIEISSIRDETPIPFNGPRPRRARRV